MGTPSEPRPPGDEPGNSDDWSNASIDRDLIATLAIDWLSDGDSDQVDHQDLRAGWAVVSEAFHRTYGAEADLVPFVLAALCRELLRVDEQVVTRRLVVVDHEQRDRIVATYDRTGTAVLGLISGDIEDERCVRVEISAGVADDGEHHALVSLIAGDSEYGVLRIATAERGVTCQLLFDGAPDRPGGLAAVIDARGLLTVPPRN